MGGEPENVDEVRAKEILSGGEFEIKIQLGIGEESAKYWTCDFSYVSLLEIFFREPFGGIHSRESLVFKSLCAAFATVRC